MDTAGGRRKKELEAAAVSVVILLLVAPQYYLATVQPDEDWSVFALAVALPAVVGAVVFTRLSRTYLFVFLAYLWSVTDDAPVNLDSVYTWPEVTSGLHHVVSEAVLHTLTAIFLYLAVREAIKQDGATTVAKWVTVSVLTIAAFVTASASIIPLPALQAAILADWYSVDVVAHGVSLVLMGMALWAARKA